MKVNFKRIIPNLILLSVSILFSIIILEIILRILKDDKYYVWHPEMEVTLSPLPQLFPGIIDESRFIVNSIGLRGDEIEENTEFKIITIGGSTTECVYLDQEEAWPYLLQKNLINETKKTIWIGNAGKSGMTTIEHIVHTEKLLKQNPDTDLILILVGINDFQKRLSSGKKYKPAKINRKIYSRAFDRIPEFNPDLPFYKKTELWNSLSRLKYFFIKIEHEQDTKGISLQNWRDNRKSANNIINELPDLTSPLSDYENSIQRIINAAEKYKTKLVFISQPVIWDENLQDEFKDLCWFGGIDNYQTQKGKDYFSIETLEQGMSMYNERLRKICIETNTFFIDLEDKLPKDTSAFYDDCHYNENGSRLVADLITEDVKKILDID